MITRDGFRSPDLFVQRIDPAANAATVLRVSREAYGAASFLDSRLMAHALDGFVMPHDHLVRWVEAIDAPLAPLHFIFHAGHVGSTLLSRLIEEASGVLALREPPTLRTLALMHDVLSHSAPAESSFDLWSATQVRLWRRGYDDTRCVVLKATSDTARIGQRLMQLAPEAKAILLNLSAEVFIAMTLSRASLVDLHTKASERAVRLGKMLGDIPPAITTGQAAAMSWLAEHMTHERLLHPWPTRTLRLDFDELLSDPDLQLSAVFRHLEIEAPPALVGDAAAHPLMQRYSKNPDRSFSLAERAERLQRSRVENSEDIRSGLAWIDAVARLHPRAAAALAA